jgi:L-alanine-DL-glutamate epimerase-like enolase superfamily enzyme
MEKIKVTEMKSTPITMMKLMKIKIGLEPSQDVKNDEAVREALGDDVGLYVDANQGYSFDTAVKTLSLMEEFDLLRIERPIPKHDMQGLVEICRAIRTPIVADEAVGDIHSVYKLISNKAADIINIKSVLHGLLESKKIDSLCEASGVPCYRGSMAFLGICDTEVHHVASTPNVIFPIVPGAKRPEELVDTVNKERLKPERGMIKVPHSPGLGVELNEKKLAK